MKVYPVLAQSLHFLRRYRAIWLWTGWLAALVALVAYSLAACQIAADNALIVGLKQGRDLDIPANARPDVILARALSLLHYERVDDARPLVETLAAAAHTPAHTPADDARATAALYSMGNARMRQALIPLQRGDPTDTATATVRLAKDAYLSAMRLDPQHWDAKYNHDVASRLVRDFPVNEQDDEGDPPDPLSKLWTELPGLPRGLP